TKQDDLPPVFVLFFCIFFVTLTGRKTVGTMPLGADSADVTLFCSVHHRAGPRHWSDSPLV
ncbi:hypothetical protein P3452_23510, partial [Vibrio parahaemolyticus]|nr:hypothetical protein [Vibrio parahaemolyticus]